MRSWWRCPSISDPYTNNRSRTGFIVLCSSARVQDEDVMNRRDDTTFVVHGRRIHDPYRWLENSDDPAVRSWVDAQSVRTREALDRLEHRASIVERLEGLHATTDVSKPALRGRPGGAPRYFRLERRAGDEHPRLLYRDGVDGEDHEIWSPDAKGDGPSSVDYYEPSPTGRLVAVGLSADGSEESTLYLLEVESGRTLPDEIAGARGSSVRWLPAETGFYYTQTRADDAASASSRGPAVCFHRLGSEPATDTHVEAPLEPSDYPFIELSPSGRWLVLTVFIGFSHTVLYQADLDAEIPTFCRLTTAANLHLPTVRDDVVFVLTDDGAERFRLMAFDPRNPRREAWREAIREGAGVLEHIAILGDELVATYQLEGVSQLARFDAPGSHRGEIALPAPGVVSGCVTAVNCDEALIVFESFDVPRSLRRIEPASSSTIGWIGSAASPATSRKMARYTTLADDGTEIPYVLVTADGGATEARPTVLYGYGGFGVSVRPSFNAVAQVLVERGFNYGLASVRGGGERGREWHRLGRGHHKQNAFDDFVRVADDLVQKGLTRPEMLGAWGRSNGGLLVLGAITRRPDLFTAAVAQVPLTDMVRYPEFLLGHLWVSEYGDPRLAGDLDVLLSYSPYHRVRAGQAYPAALLTTADNDTRVHPLHARKMAAALQDASTSARPVLLRSETAAGHGAANRTSKILAEQADIAAFFVWQLHGVAARHESGYDDTRPNSLGNPQK
jgi:prolyl oligopeptidase